MYVAKIIKIVYIYINTYACVFVCVCARAVSKPSDAMWYIIVMFPSDVGTIPHSFGKGVRP